MLTTGSNHIGDKKERSRSGAGNDNQYHDQSNRSRGGHGASGGGGGGRQQLLNHQSQQNLSLQGSQQAGDK